MDSAQIDSMTIRRESGGSPGPDLLSIVIVSYRSGSVLDRCLRSIVGRSDIATEIIIVDNDSSDGVVSNLKQTYPLIQTIVAGRNLGFAAAANLGLARARGRWLLLLNPDTIVPPGALGLLLDVLRRTAGCGVVAPRLIAPNGAAQPFSHGSEPDPLYLFRRLVARASRRSLQRWDGARPRSVDWVSGACMMVRREAFTAIGPLDERFFLYFEDVDWCRRLREAGWNVWFIPSITVIHDSFPDYSDLGRRACYRASLRAYYRKYHGRPVALALALATRWSGWRSG